jgi:uncharacterized protein with beta-barrel porin domain
LHYGSIGGRHRLRLLLASSSVAAILIGGGAPVAVAAPCVNKISSSFDNPAGNTVANVCVDNTSFTGAITNEGTISPSGIAFVNGTITGFVGSTGVINGGISLDKTSAINGTFDAIFIGGRTSGGGTVTVPSFSGGITNAGTITAPGDGIFVGGTANNRFGDFSSVTISNFAGGITNSGTIFAGFANGIFIGGLAEGSTTNITVSTFTGGITNTGLIETFGTTQGGGIVVGGEASGGIFANISTLTISTFGGEISNSGTIAAATNAIFVGGKLASTSFLTISTFNGGITNSGTLSAGLGGSGGDGIIVGGTVQRGPFEVGGAIEIETFTGSIVNSGTIAATAGNGIVLGGHATGSQSTIAIGTFGGSISNSGTIVASGHGILVGGTADNQNVALDGPFVTISTFAGRIANSGTISAGASGNGIFVGGSAVFGGFRSEASVTIGTFAGGISNGGLISAGGHGIFVGGTASFVSEVVISTFAGGISNSGVISAGGRGIFVGGRSSIGGFVSIGTFSGGITNSGTIVATTGIVVGSQVFGFSGAIANSGTISGTGGTAIDVSGAVNAMTIDQTGGLISGAILLSANADQLNISGGTIAGNIVGSGSSDNINFNLGSGTFTYASAYGFTGISQVNVNSGTVILDGTNQAVTIVVDGGLLEVGDAANPGALLEPGNLSVTGGGVLAGNGTIGGQPVVDIDAGGTLAPGTPGGVGTLTIAGQLSFNNGAASIYAIDITPGGTNSKTAITGAGTASLSGNGTVVVTPLQLGAHYDTIYQILTTPSPAQLSGQFAGLTVNGGFAGTMRLDYTTNPGDVDLDVNGFAILGTPTGGTINEQNVANGINNYLLSGGTLPPQFADLANLSGPALLNALNQLDGEDATGAQKSAFQLMQDFLNMLLDPSLDGQGGGAGGQATPFAPERDASLPPDIALAYAHALHQKPPQSEAPQDFDQRWSAWAGGFGGTGTTDGNATVGSTNVTATDYGYAAGMTYHVTPGTDYGFALAGGGTNWNLAQNLGNGRSDSFQAGVYGTTHFGPAYLSGALAFANHWFTTNRIAMGDNLTAKFQGQSYAARGEAGYRYAVPVTGYIVGVTPYAALQVQDFHTPGYSETDLSGGGFGLTYNAVNATDTRSELGARFDNLTVWNGMPLVLRGRLAWAHDWVSNPALGAVFQALPGSNFTVNGAPPPKNSALTTAGAELHLNANWTAMAKFDGEFGSGSQTYAGTGTLKYSW